MSSISASENKDLTLDIELTDTLKKLFLNDQIHDFPLSTHMFANEFQKELTQTKNELKALFGGNK